VRIDGLDEGDQGNFIQILKIDYDKFHWMERGLCPFNLTFTFFHPRLPGPPPKAFKICFKPRTEAILSKSETIAGPLEWQSIAFKRAETLTFFPGETLMLSYITNGGKTKVKSEYSKIAGVYNN
jgi:hypothetical protein